MTLNTQQKKGKIFSAKVLSVFLFLIYPAFLNAQTNFIPGFIITNEQDTVYGYIDYRGDKRNAEYCSFRLDQSTKPIVYNPFDIKGFRYSGGKYYVSMRMKSENGNLKDIFAEFLVDGIANLYYFRDDLEHYLIEKENSDIIELSNVNETVYYNGTEYKRATSKYIGILRGAFSDCMEIQNDVYDVELSQKSLINITKEYHDLMCSDEKCIIYQKDIPVFKFQFAPYLAINTSSLTFLGEEYLSYFEIDRIVYPAIGVMLNSSLPRINDKIFLQINLEISQQNYYGINTNFYGDAFHELFIHELCIKTNYSLKYTYPKGIIRPTGSVGVGFASAIMEKSTELIQNMYGEITINDDPFYEPNQFYYTFRSELGFELHYPKRTYFASFYLSNDRLFSTYYANAKYINAGLYAGFFL